MVHAERQCDREHRGFEPLSFLRYGALAAAAIALSAAILLPATVGAAQLAAGEACAQESFENADYVVCTLEPGKADLRLFWKGADGAPYRYFSSIAAAVQGEGKTLSFAVNAGMYLTDFSPIGLYVENGREMRAASLAKPPAASAPVPNFDKTPNGVFFLDETGAGILPTDVYLQRRPQVRLATQSGPMLVIKNKINPIFIVGSTDRTRRSGVGVCGDGVVRFAISEGVVNFNDFARLFRDHLRCADALFLDGGRGVGIYDPAMGRNDLSWHGGFGPVFGLVE
jgi:uncharacterized protein YigE (DUF2233 family)